MTEVVLIFLKSINPRVWIGLAIAVALAVGGATLYHAGGNKPRAELAQLQASIKVAQQAHAKEDALRESQHTALVKGKDDERTKDIADTAASWRSYADSLRTAPSSPNRDQKPVRIVAERCDNAPGNQDVSAAVSKYRDDVRAILADAKSTSDGLRDGSAKLLEICDKQTGALVRVQSWAGSEQQINLGLKPPK